MNLDPDELEWTDLSLCRGSDTQVFFEEYERSTSLAEQVDEMCLRCPVFKQCTDFAEKKGEHGVWGAVYYTGGKIDKYKNQHKTPEVWQRIENKKAS